MKLRTDSLHIAGWKRAHGLNGCPNKAKILGRGSKGVEDECVCSSQKPEYTAVPPAELGDLWIVRRKATADAEPWTSGYALTCPNEACDQGVHPWDHAYDCERKFDQGHPSCWTWTGSIEDDTLTASPSLHVVAERGGCGWHGWLRDGQMVPA